MYTYISGQSSYSGTKKKIEKRNLSLFKYSCTLKLEMEIEFDEQKINFYIFHNIAQMQLS